ncbi:phosphatase PAP2 family protein [Photobacterium swingsii]|uniref:phosphatase PAP2 family protein n=1 Tax=Photobacterium swingsii TaxID=680026 RepID=UPI00352EC08D
MMMPAPIQRFDNAFSAMCLCHRYSQAAAAFSRHVSRTGDGPLYLIFALCAWWFDSAQGRELVVTGLTAFAIELPLYVVLKNSVKRSRPSHLPSFITPSDKYSLPSGHTAAAFIMAALITSYYPELAWLVWPWALLIGLSRVLLGVHYISDILVGAVFGLACFEFASLS